MIFNMNALRIYVDGYFDYNFGDDVMVYSLIDYLLANHYLVFMKKPDEFVGLELFNKYNSKVKFIQDDNIQTLKVNGVQVYVNIGGSIFPHRSVKEGVFRYFTLKKYLKIKRNGIKLCIINCNIGTFTCKVGINATKCILKLADYITCRDEYSYNFIKSINKKVLFYPDVLFSVFSEMNLHNNHTPTNIIGISTYMGHKSYSQKDNANIYNFLHTYIEQILYENAALRIKLFSFDGGYNSDLPMAHKLKNNSRFNEKIDVVAYEGEIECFVKELSMLDKIIGLRFHSIVFSLAASIPCIPIIYEKKTEELLKQIGYSKDMIYTGEINTYSAQNSKNCIIPSDFSVEKLVQESYLHFLSFSAFCNQIKK